MDNKVYSSHCAEGKLQSLREQQERAELPFETGNALGTPPDCDTCRGLEEQGMTSGVSYPFPLVFWRDSTLDEKRRYMEEFSEPFIQKLSWLRWVSTSASSSV